MNIADRSFSVQAGKIIPHERWGWEQRKEINVFGVSRPLRREALGQVRLEIQALLDEFDLPIQATVGSAGPSLNALVRLLRQCSHGRSLDVPTFVDRLNDARRSRKIFESALVILVGDKDYEPFGEPPDKAPGFSERVTRMVSVCSVPFMRRLFATKVRTCWALSSIAGGQIAS
jgi:hypothetical protein